MQRKALIGIAGAMLILTACSSGPPTKSVTDVAIERGFTVIGSEKPWPVNTSYTSVGVRVGGCTGTFYRMDDNLPFLDVFNKQGVEIIDQWQNPTAHDILTSEPAIDACKVDETPPTQTTAR